MGLIEAVFSVHLDFVLTLGFFQVRRTFFILRRTLLVHLRNQHFLVLQVQKSLQQNGLLVSFEGVPYEIDVFFILFVFSIVFIRNPGFFFFKVIEVLGVNVATQVRDKRSLFVSDVFPVDACKEGVGFDFLDSMHSKSFALVCYQPFKKVNSCMAEVGFWRNDEGFSPIKDFLAGLARVV